jgi:hypothetical protein
MLDFDNPPVKKEFDVQLTPETCKALEEAKGFIVQNDLQSDEAAKLCKQIKKGVKEIQEVTKPIISEAHKKHKDLKLAENVLIDPLKEAEKELKEKIGEYTSEKLKRQEELQKRLEKEAEENGDLAPAVTMSKTKGFYQVTEYGFEVLDITKIPIEYLMVNESKLKDVIKAHKGEVKIAGIKVTSSKSNRLR